MSQKLKLSQCIDGLLFYKRAEGKSQNTLNDYRNGLSKLSEYLKDDPPLADVTRAQLVGFFAWLRDDYIRQPNGCIPRGPIKLAPKTILNIHTALSAMWHWAVDEGILDHNIVRAIKLPDAQSPVVQTFTKDEIEAMLKACRRTAAYSNNIAASNERPTGDRDTLIVLLLLDTGLRAQELCDIKIGDANISANSIKVIGKGRKERMVYFGKRTSKALWKYLLPRVNTMQPGDPLFFVGPADDPRALQRHVLTRLIKRIGARAGVRNVYPHKFRHSFAINYLRNNGDVFTLQQLLGHSDLKMVRRYAQVAQTDCARVHQTASPVDNWKL
jgi:integrase/recombinase XerD